MSTHAGCDHTLTASIHGAHWREFQTSEMTQFLPPNLLALFAPRDPIPYLPPIEKHAHHRKLPYTGVAQFLGEFEVSWVLFCHISNHARGH